MSASPLTPHQEAVKSEFIEVRKTWNDTWETVLRLDADFLQAYLRFSAVPWTDNRLPGKIKELIYIAIDANATHMYLPGVRQHVRAALALGATPAEIMEVLELSAMLGMSAMTAGVPILAEVLRDEGARDTSSPPSERQEQVKADAVRDLGVWHELWDGIVEFAPDLLEAYTDLLSVPWHRGPLEPKVKELVGVAVDTAATNRYGPGLKAHIRRARQFGATVAEIVEVMEIAAVVGVHGVMASAPILAEELAALAGSPDSH